jgi:hypothetical protein
MSAPVARCTRAGFVDACDAYVFGSMPPGIARFRRLVEARQRGNSYSGLMPGATRHTLPKEHRMPSLQTHRCRSFDMAIVSLLLCAWASAAGPAWAQDAAAAPSLRMHDALEEYERGHYAQAFATFALLADQRHPEAARIAVQMWLNGPALYRMEFDASPDQVESWRRERDCAAGVSRTPCALVYQAP